MLRHLLVWLVGGAVACAQSVSGTLTGIVRDLQNAAVPAAKVVARNLDTGAKTSAETDAEGWFRLLNLPPGDYSVEITAPGFRKMTIATGRLGAAEVVRVEAALEIGQLTETVAVEGAATQVNTEEAQLGRTIRDIPRLPLLSTPNGRAVMMLALLTPGLCTTSSTTQQGKGSVNGQRFYSNNFQFDGGDANNQVTGDVEVSAFWLSPNATAELRLVSGPMNAEFGRNSGSVAIVTPKSGGNQWHGVASETFRNTVLNAVPFFQKAIAGGTTTRLPSGAARNAQWNANDFDANVGGPLRKNRTFVFLSYFGFRLRHGVQRSAVVPSDTQRAAIESQGTPQARALLALVPRATYGNTLQSINSNALSRDQGLVKMDHTISQANRFSATYFIEDWPSVQPYANANSRVPGFGIRNEMRSQHLVLKDTHAFTPRLFHDFRATFHRRATNGQAPLNRTPLASLGLGKIVPDDPGADGPPLVSISGFSNFGNTANGPRADKTTQFQYLDNVTWTKGRHTFKFGGDFRTFAMNTTSDTKPNGEISIDGSGTQNGLVRLIPALAGDPSLNDFATGYASVFSQGSSSRVSNRSRSLNAFLQDDWKVSPSFTLNIGLRWEFNGRYTDTRDRVVSFRRGQRSTVFPDAPTGMVFPGDPGVSRSTYGNDYNNFSPRFGFAWDVLKSGRLSLRGGYALLYDAPFQDILMGAEINSPPFSIQPTTRSTDYANPWLGSRINPLLQPFPHTPPKAGDRLDFTRFAPLTFTFLDPSFRTPYGQQWTLQAQYQLDRNWLLEAAYVGSNGVKLSNERTYNYALAGLGASVPNTDQRRILNQGNPENAKFGGSVFGSVDLHAGNSNSNYNALQASATRRLTRGLQMSHNYTWSHTIDNASGRQVKSRNDPRQDRGNSDMDQRHRYVLSLVYELPFRGRWLGGWGASGLATFQSGVWMSVTESQDRCLCDTGNQSQRADSLGIAIRYLDPRSPDAVPGRPNSWFDGTGGGDPTGTPNPYFRRVGSGPLWVLGAGRYGNAGRNTIRTPGTNNWQLAAFKKTRLREGQELELRAECFNAFNHTQFGFPDVNIGSPNFGRVTSAKEPRIVQLGLRYRF